MQADGYHHKSAILPGAPVIDTVIDPSAEITRFADGRPVRLQQNGRLAKPMGLEFSVKNGDHVPWESKNEQRALWHAEMSSAVVAYRAQPHTLRLVLDGRRVSYTPDLLLECVDGAIDIVEVKDAFEENKDPDYTDKLERAAVIYRALGWSFLIVTKAQLEAEPVFSDVELLHHYRKAALLVEHINDVQIVLAGGPTTLKALRRVLPPDPMGIAQLSAIIVNRVVGVDLSNGLVDDAVVALPDAWPWPKPFSRGVH